MAAIPRLLGRRCRVLVDQSLGTEGYPDFGVVWLWVNIEISLLVAILTLKGYATALGFIAYTIALLVKAPKASPSFVFVETNNATGQVMKFHRVYDEVLIKYLATRPLLWLSYSACSAASPLSWVWMARRT